MGYVLSFRALLKVVMDLRKDNDIVLTHGAFDLFHYSHLEFLRLSKKRGNILIIGVDPDNSLKYYKNTNRPVLTQIERATILSRIEYSDFVFPVHFPIKSNQNLSLGKIHSYYLNLYKVLKPKVVTYGKDYSGMQTINEAKDRFKDIKFTKITHKYSNLQSTTKIIDKILSSQK